MPSLHYTLQYLPRVIYALLALYPSIFTKSHLCPPCTIPFNIYQESLMPSLHYTLQFWPRVTYTLLALYPSILTKSHLCPSCTIPFNFDWVTYTLHGIFSSTKHISDLMDKQHYFIHQCSWIVGYFGQQLHHLQQNKENCSELYKHYYCMMLVLNPCRVRIVYHGRACRTKQAICLCFSVSDLVLTAFLWKL